MALPLLPEPLPLAPTTRGPRAVSLALAVLCLMLPSIGCGSSEPSVDAPTPGEPSDSPAFVLGSRIRTPDGRAFFVSIEPDLEARELDLSRAIELSGFARTYTFDGALYTMDSESLVIRRFRVGADRTVTEDGRFSMAFLGFTRFRPLFAFVEPTRAYYIDPQSSQVVVWNPAEMVLIETLPFDGLFRENFDIRQTGLREVGDRIFLPFAWTRETEFVIVPSVTVLVFDRQTGELEGIFEDDRCVGAGGSFATENGDFYVLGDSHDGRFDVFGEEELPPPCLLRIRSGADGFDPDYYVDMREAMGGAVAIGHMNGLPNGRAVTRVLAIDIDPATVEDPFDLTFQEIWQWVTFDVANPEPTLLDIPLTALPFSPFLVDGSLYVPREGEADSTLYRIDGTQAIAGPTVPGEYLQLHRLR
ncbi:MAG: hypothetical protein AAF500_15635 [Myxococcota bacterium]